jgi:hypothetical protein
MTWGVWRSASGFGPQIGGVVNVPADAAAASTWDSAETGANITLSGGDLTATASTGSFHFTRSTSSLGAGKRVIKYTTTDSNNSHIGVSNDNAVQGTWLGAQGTDGAVWATQGGEVWTTSSRGFLASFGLDNDSPVWMAFEDTGAVINFWASNDGSTWAGPVSTVVHITGTKYFTWQGQDTGENITVDFSPGDFSGLASAVDWDS